MASATRSVLNLGVLNQPYATPGRRRPITTVEVAHYLEDGRNVRPNYHLFSTFARVHANSIQAELTQAMQRNMRTLIMGGPREADPYRRAYGAIENGFRQFVTSRQAERVGIPGTPTMAALLGISHRFANPRRRANPRSKSGRVIGARRPSFRDTGLLIASFRAWITGGS